MVTGAHGFLGRHAARHLAAAGWTVTGVGHGAWSAVEARAWGVARWLAADVDDRSLAEAGPAELVIHCAGGSSVARSIADPAADYARSVGTARALLRRAASQDPPPRVVLVSSVSVYGSTDDGAAHEAAPLRPQSPYARHKRMAEELWEAEGAGRGVPAVSVRLPSVYGRGLRKQILWDACQKLRRAQDAVFFGTGAETRDYLHVDDAARLLIVAGEHATTGSTAVNGGTGRAVPVRELLDLVAACLGGGCVRFTGSLPAGDPAHLTVEVSRAHGWGWRSGVALADGVRDYCAWFLEGAR